MGSHNHFDSKPGFDVFFKVLYSRAGWITHDHSGSQVDGLYSVLGHFFRDILDVSAGAAIACGVSGYFHLLIFVSLEGPFPVSKSFEAFTSTAPVVAVADDDSDFVGV